MVEDANDNDEITMADGVLMDGPYVIIVDDQPRFRNLFSEVAKSYGFGCVTEDCAEDFIVELGKLTRSRRPLPQFLFMDIQMEDDKAGFRALKRVKQSARGRIREVPTIMVSKSGAAEDVCMAYKAGAAHFIKKSENPTRSKDDLVALFEYWKRDEVRRCVNG